MVVLIQKISEAFAKDKWISLGITLILASRMRAKPKCKITSNQAGLLLEGLILYCNVRGNFEPSKSLVRETSPIL